jgi:hypothetical protein
VIVGTWGTGPFDNDDAADWLDGFLVAEAGDRPALLTSAFREASTEKWSPGSEERAIAAGAVLVRFLRDDALPDSMVPGNVGHVLESSLPADQLPDLVELALSILDRVLDGESQWRKAWNSAEPGDQQEAVLAVTGLFLALAEVDLPR